MNRVILLGTIATVALAQQPLTLQDAVRQALAQHPTQEAALADVRAAQARIEQARSGYLPRASYSEFFQTSNQPVFAFGALLNQRQFEQSNFAIDALNHPGFIENFRSQVSVEQNVWDFGVTRDAIRAAGIGKDITEQQQRLEHQQRVAIVARAYHAVTLAQEARKVAEAALQSAEADLRRAEAVRDAGMSTDADVLSLRVHHAAVREQEIRLRYQADVALAALNEAMGVPLDTPHDLTTPLAEAEPAAGGTGERAEIRQAELARDLSETQLAQSRRAYLPQITAQAVFEADRARFVTRGGANWFFGAGLKWSLFDGARRQRIEEANQALVRAKARERQVAAQVSLEVRRSQAALAAARERLRTAAATVSEAEESVRIIRNRYEAGLARIDELLRTEVAILDARMRRLQAVYDQRMAVVEVELAAGTLTENSNVLQ